MQNPNQPFNQSNPFDYSSAPVPVAQASGEVRLEFLRKTYSLFLAGIICSMLVGALTLRTPALLMAAYGVLTNPLIALVLIVGGSFGARAVSRIEGVNYAALFGFTGLLGWIITPLLYMYEARQPGIVTQAAIMTSLTFGALTAYVFVSKKDFNFLGGMLFVGIIGLVLGGLVNLFFFHSLGASYFMAWFTLLLFSGFVLYDTSNIMNRTDSRGYCSAALELYLDFFNMFLAILRILGGRR